MSVSLMRRPWVTKCLVVIYDVFLAGLSMHAAIVWRYDFENKDIPANLDITAALVCALIALGVWVFTRAYKGIWRFTSLNDVRHLTQAVFLVTVLTPLMLFLFVNRADDFPRSVPFIAGPLFLGLLILSRVIYVIFSNGDFRAMFARKDKSKPNAILVGSEISIHEHLRMFRRRNIDPAYNIIGLIDTDISHKGRSIFGVPVLGTLDRIQSIYANVATGYSEPPTLIATDMGPDRMRAYDLVRVASIMGAPLVRVDAAKSGQLTPFEAADLIGRPVRSLDIAPVRRFIKGKRVLITGAGGSIGSELTRQLSALSPAHMTLVDSSELHMYTLENELRDMLPKDTSAYWTCSLVDVRDAAALDDMFTQQKPDIVFHAAALKHVPLGETNPLETLKTNICGTQNVLNVSKAHGVKSFTLISSDKAVNPSSVMGASKRVAEMLVLGTQKSAKDISCCAVRFGNVLASNGSVIPLFEAQIARGGPVTITHQDVNRYFMTTEEAAALVLQASALNMRAKTEKASIYVLEMGVPVNIAALARQLIRLRGFVPERDIEITFTGLRPGEKLTEILTYDQEELRSTRIEGVQIFTGDVVDPKSIERRIGKIIRALEARDKPSIRQSLEQLVPSYTPNGNLQ